MKAIKVLSLLIGSVLYASFSYSQFFSIQNVSHPDVSACSEGTEHSVTFQNNFGEPVSEIILEVDLAEGLSFVGVISSQFVIEDNTDPELLTFSYSGVLGIGESLDLVYVVSAQCQEALPVSTKYHIVCDATVNPEENDNSTVNYNFTAASLNFIQVSNSSLQLMPNSEFQRILTVRNAGNESISEAILEMSYTTEGLTLLNSSHGVLEGVIITLGPDDFTNGTLDPEEDFEITLDYHYESCFSVTSEYVMTWGCPNSDVCQQIYTSATTTFPTGEPNLTIEAAGFENPGACESPGYSEFMLTNESTESLEGAATANTVKLSTGFGSTESGSIALAKYMGSLFIVESIEVDGIVHELTETIIDPTLGDSSIYQIIIPEIPVGMEKLVRVNWYYNPPNQDNPICSEFLDQIRFYGQLNLQANYSNKCGISKPRTFCPGPSDIMQFKYVSEEFISPTDAVDGETFTMGVEKEMNIRGPLCEAPFYRMVMTLPVGVSYEPGTEYARLYGQNRPVSASLVGNELTLNMTLDEANFLAAYGPIEIGAAFTLGCPVNLDAGVKYEIYSGCNECSELNEMSKLACNTSFKLNAYCGTCEGLQMSSDPVLYRTTYGFSDATLNERLTYAEVSDLDGLNKVFTNDVVHMEIPANVHGTDGINLFEFEITYNKFAYEDQNIFEPKGVGIFEIFDASTGAEYEIYAGIPVSSGAGLTAELSYVVSGFDGPNPPPNDFTLDEDDEIKFVGDFRITENTLANLRTELVLLPGLRFRFNVPGAQCNSKGAELYVAHPFVTPISATGILEPSGCSSYHVGFAVKNQGADNIDWFEDEFRPVYYPNSIRVKVPNEWIYDSGTSYLEVLPMGECGESEYETYVLEDPLEVLNSNGSTYLIWNNSTGDWPIKDDGCAYYQNQFALWFNILPSCRFADDNLDELTFRMDITDNYYTVPEYQEEQIINASLVLAENILSIDNFNLTSLNSQINTTTSEAVWNFRLSSTTITDTLENVWIYANPEQEGLDILSAFLVENNEILPTEQAGNGAWFRVPAIFPGAFYDFSIQSEIGECSDGLLSVSAGMDCAIDFDSFNPENFPCPTKEIEVSFSPENSGIQLNFTGPEQGLVMCESNLLELTINNALLGYIEDITVTLEIPEDIFYDSSSSYLQYPGPSESTSTPGEISLGSLPEPDIIANFLIWQLEDLLPQHIAENGLPGAQISDSNSVHLSIALAPTCPFISGSQTRMLVNAVRACGEPLEEISTSYIELNIENVQPNYSSLVDLNFSDFEVCSDTTDVQVGVILPEIDGDAYTTIQDQFQLFIPIGAKLNLENRTATENAVSLVNSDPIIDTLSGSVRYNWPMPENLEDGESFSFSSEILTSELVNGPFQIRARTINSDEITCDGESCSIGVVQGTDHVDLEKRECTVPIMDLIIFPEGGGCLEDSILLTFNETAGMPLDTAIWHFGDGNHSNSDSIYVTYNEIGVYSGSLLASNVLGDTLYTFEVAIEEEIDPYFEYSDFNVLDPSPAMNVLNPGGTFSLVDPEDNSSSPLFLELDGEVVFISPEDGTIYNAISDTEYTVRYTTGEFCQRIHDVTVESYALENNPIAVDDEFIGFDNEAIDMDFLQNDFDPNGDIIPSLTQVLTLPIHGQVSFINNSYMEYVPDLNFVGSDSLVYRIFDSENHSSTAKVSIEIINTPDPPVATDDFSQVQFDEPFVANLIENDYDPDGAINESSFTITSFPEHGNVLQMQSGVLEYTAINAYLGYDYLEYEICDNEGMCTQGTWTILVYDYNTECANLFLDDEIELEIENCESSGHLCLPYDYEDADHFEVYIDGALQNDLEICQEITYHAYDLLSGNMGNCPEELWFPIVIESWVIDGEEFSSGNLDSWSEVELFMNTIDPCGFWMQDGNGQIRGGMVILNYEELVVSSNCGASDLHTWTQYTIPQNLKVLLPAEDCNEVVVRNTFYENCADTVEVCVPCLGIINTPPYSVNDQDIVQDVFFVNTYSESMMNYCLSFEDDENHIVGISIIEESVLNPDVFYEPEDFCFCYTSPDGYVGPDTLVVNFCDSGDPTLCSQATIYINVLENDGLNTIPFTTDIYNAPEDTLYRYIQMNEISEMCLDFGDLENHNVHINDIIDLYEGSVVSWDSGANCYTYSPPPNYVGVDLLMVNYCDDGDPFLCGATWIVIEILPTLPINTAPVLMQNGAIVSSVTETANAGTPEVICLDFYDNENHDVGLADITTDNGAYISYIPGTNCITYIGNSSFSGTDELSITFCDEGAPEGLCTEGSIIIEVTPGIECPELLEPDYYFESSSCPSFMEILLPYPHVNIDEHLITVDGTEYMGGESLGSSSYIVYDFSEIAENICFQNGDMQIQMQNWMYNGTANNIFGEVETMEEIVAHLNEEDNIGFWSYNSTDHTVYSLSNTNSYQLLQLLVSCNGNQFESLNLAPSSINSFAGLALDLSDGQCHEISIYDENTGCVQSASVCIGCVQNGVPYATNLNGFQIETLTFSVDEDETEMLCFELTDPDGDEVNVESIINSQSGASFILQPDSWCVEYTPPSNFSGTDVLTVQFCDDVEAFECGTLTINVIIQDVNDPPVALNDQYSIQEGELLEANILINDYDAEDDPFFFFQIETEPVGEAIVANGILDYAAPANFCGEDGFTYSICDAFGNCSSAEVFIQVNPMDSDNDGIPDFVEGNVDTDLDGLVDSEDLDSDNDNIPDAVEAYNEQSVSDYCQSEPIDSDNDGIPNYIDSDSDADHIPDLIEGFYDCDGDGMNNYVDPTDDCEYSELLNPNVSMVEGFSPNGDGDNDLFVIQGMELFTNPKLTVFNRYGNVVYVAQPYLNDWNGSSSFTDMPLPSSTYYYVLELSPDVPAINGFVYIKYD